MQRQRFFFLQGSLSYQYFSRGSQIQHQFEEEEEEEISKLQTPFNLKLFLEIIN